MNRRGYFAKARARASLIGTPVRVAPEVWAGESEPQPRAVAPQAQQLSALAWTLFVIAAQLALVGAVVAGVARFLALFPSR